MDFVGKDLVILALYIVLTIVLILVGKYAGMKLFETYHKIDPGSYKSNCSYNRYDIYPKFAPDGTALPESEQKTPEQIEAEIEACAKTRAQDDGRTIGGIMGGILGFLLIAGKTYQLYKEYTVSN